MSIQVLTARPARINKLGNSQGVVIPKNVLAAAGLAVGDRVDFMLTESGELVVHPTQRRFDAPRKRTAAELFASYEGDYSPTETSWGQPVGKEMW